jgi:drug/metabolite transporter (DMT)-like permease
MRARDWVQLIILSVLWGATFFLVAIALREMPPLTLVLARCVIAALVLVPVVYLLGFRFPQTRDAWRNFLVMSVLNNIIPFGLIFYAQQAVPSGIAAVLNATTPLMSLLVLRVLAGEAMTTNKIAGVLIGLLGVGVLVSPTAGDSQSATSFLAMLAILGATLSYGLSGLWGRRFKAIPSPVTAAGQLLCSSLLMLPIAGLADQFWAQPMPSTPVIMAILALGILSTAMAYILFFQIMASAGPLNVMLVTLLIPFTTIALGALFLGEALTGRQIAGAVVIGVSLLVIDGRLFGRKPAG